MKCYFSRGLQNTDRPSTLALYVNNCGYYKEMDEPLEIVRPHGRQDYQLLLCVRGVIEADGQRLESGDAYLFFPNQKQVYTYLPAADSRYCWVHFTGTGVENILKKAALSQGRYRCQARVNDLDSLFRLLIAERAKSDPAADVLTASLCATLLMLIPAAQTPTSPFLLAVKRLEDFSSEVQIKELADMYKMSTGHFIRAFRSYFGESPYQYRRQRQLDLAKMLLDETELSVAGVAARVGIDDPLYFSRIFKKYVGLSPSQYRHR